MKQNKTKRSKKRWTDQMYETPRWNWTLNRRDEKKSFVKLNGILSPLFVICIYCFILFVDFFVLFRHCSFASTILWFISWKRWRRRKKKKIHHAVEIIAYTSIQTMHFLVLNFRMNGTKWNGMALLKKRFHNFRIVCGFWYLAIQCPAFSAWIVWTIEMAHKIDQMNELNGGMATTTTTTMTTKWTQSLKFWTGTVSAESNEKWLNPN